MDIWEKGKFTHAHNNQIYTITKIEQDISSAFGKPEGCVELSHKIEGFPVTLYMITDLEGGSFGFGHKVIEDGKDTGLFVTLQDENIFCAACELVESIESQNTN